MYIVSSDVPSVHSLYCSLPSTPTEPDPEPDMVETEPKLIPLMEVATCVLHMNVGFLTVYMYIHNTYNVIVGISQLHIIMQLQSQSYPPSAYHNKTLPDYTLSWNNSLNLTHSPRTIIMRLNNVIIIEDIIFCTWSKN